MSDSIDALIARPVALNWNSLPDPIEGYWKGLDEAYKRRNQDAFKNGIPMRQDANGAFAPDYSTMANTVLSKGGIPQLENFVNLARMVNSSEAGRYQATGQPGVNPWNGPIGARPQGQPGAGGRVAQEPQAGALPPPPSVTPQRPADGTITAIGEDSARTLAAKAGLPIELADNIAQTFKIDPEAPIRDPKILDRLQRGFQRIATERPPQLAQMQQPQQPAYPNTSPSSGVINSDPTVGGLVPKGVDPFQYLAGLRRQLAGGVDAPTAKSLQDTISTLEKALAPTDKIKEYNIGRLPGEDVAAYEARIAGDKAHAEERAKASVKKYDAIQEAGIRARQDLPQLQLAQRLVNSPDYYSGVGEKYNLVAKRLLSVFGGDENTAAPQEAVRKIISGLLLDGIKQMAGTGPVRVAEMGIIERANASPDNSPQTNRLLLEAAYRIQKRNADIADMAARYKGGRLDSGFDQAVAEYQRRNPLFSKDEVADFRKIANTVREAPEGSQQQRNGIPVIKSPAEAMKLGKGKQFYDPNGVLRVVP